MSHVFAQIAVGDVPVSIARVIALAVSAAIVGGVAGIVHRWYAGRRVPDGLSVLAGLSLVAIYLNTAGALGEVIGGQLELLAFETAIFNIVTFAIAALTAVGGGRVGDRIGVDLVAVSGAKRVDADVSRIVRTVGRLTTIQIPDGIEDIGGYASVDAATKEKLSGQTLVFPRGLTVEELRRRFIERLRLDYGVGHVDVEFTADGTIEYLAIGGHESGLGPTLPPGSAAVAIRADPPNNASAGDVVQLWTDPGSDPSVAPKRVTNAELRGTAGDLVTLAMDEADAKRIDSDRQYRLVTLPVTARADREFAAQLRTAAETMGITTVEAGSVLAGNPLGVLDLPIVAVGTIDGDVEALPTRKRPIRVGETLYAIGSPDRLRKLEAAATTVPVSRS